MPILAAGILARFFPKLTERLQPWVAKLGSAALYIVLVATLVGYAQAVGYIEAGETKQLERMSPEEFFRYSGIV